MIHINKYSDIKIIENSLIVFDIDDTIIKFDLIDKEWWKNKFNYYFNLCKNNEEADNLVLKDWKSYINNNNPKLINKNDLFNFINKSIKKNCTIIFLTARDITLKNITEKHFDTCELSYYKNNIYYSKYK